MKKPKKSKAKKKDPPLSLFLFGGLGAQSITANICQYNNIIVHIYLQIIQLFGFTAFLHLRGLAKEAKSLTSKFFLGKEMLEP